MSVPTNWESAAILLMDPGRALASRAGSAAKTLGLAVARLGGGVPSALEPSPAPGMVVSATSRGGLAATWTETILAVWAAGFAALLLRLAAGFAYMGAVRARSMPLPDRGWRCELARIAGTLGIARPVRLLQSNDPAAIPLAWGLFHPKILVPSSAVEWPDDRRRIVFLHELTHIARLDCPLQILGEFVRAVHWFNPLAWLAVSRLRREGECACDDSVLNSGVRDAAALAGSVHLERRFLAMLNANTDRRAPREKSKLFTAFAALCVLIPLAALRLPGQDESGKFTGTVYDPSGAAIPNATIIMVGERADTRDMTTSDATGKFAFSRLPRGEYEFQVMKPGFKPYTKSPVTLETGRDLSLNANLEIGAVEESVNVTGQRSAEAGSARATVANQNPKRLRIGGEVEAAQLLTRVVPVYPESAKAAGVEGTVVLHGIVGMDGRLLSLRVRNGQVNPDLARAAVESVSHWRYRPTLLNGHPVEVDTTIQVNFALEKE